MLKLLDLFSGIGGFSLGMEATNQIKTIAFVEKDKFCQKVLQKNFKNIPIEEDIRNVKGSNYAADIVSGGFPCQPFSVAGKRRGKDDDRYLWDETIRVVAETKPKYFVGENVEGIVNISNGTILQQIQKDLEAENFQVQCLIIPASGIGAWHQRKRVWIIGCNLSNSNNSGCKDRTEQLRGKQTQNEKGFDSSSRSNIISNSDSYGSHRQKRNETKQSSNEQEKRLSFGNDKDVPNTDSRMRRRWGTIGQSRANEIWGFYPEKEKQTEYDIWSKTIGCDALLREENVTNTNSKRSQRCQLQSNNLQEKNKTSIYSNNSFKKQQTWWETQSGICGVPNGISYELDKGRSNRIKALGNSIVPQIAYEIGKAIVDAENQSN